MTYIAHVKTFYEHFDLIMFLLWYYGTLYNLLSQQFSQNILKMLQLKRYILVYIKPYRKNILNEETSLKYSLNISLKY